MSGGIRVNYSQLNIYSVLGLTTDTIYTMILSLKENEEIEIKGFVIRKTLKFYEVENQHYHEHFSCLEDCYMFVDNLINKES